MPVQTAIQVRRGTASSWTSTNPTLAAGEIGFETDTSKFKIGTGSTAWNSLNYFVQDPVTTKGDLYTFSTTDARLAVGNNGETLVADSSQTTGLRYNPQNALANPVINGGMDIWQRGTSFTTTTALSANTADRWCAYTGSTGRTVSRQTTSDTTNLPNIQYCLRYQRDSGTTNTNVHYLITQFETTNTIPFLGKTVTLSFYARKGALFSSTDGGGNQIAAAIRTSTSTDGNVLAGPWVGDASPVSGTTTGLSTTWQRYAFTGTISTSAQSLCVQITCNPTGTAGATDYYEVTGVQIDLGTYTASSAPTFRRTGGTLAGELAACERYYQIVTGQMLTGVNTTTIGGSINFRTQMRTGPSASLSAAMNLRDAGADYAQSSANIAIASSRTNERGVQIEMGNFTSVTANRPYFTNVTLSQMQFSAEL